MLEKNKKRDQRVKPRFEDFWCKLRFSAKRSTLRMTARGAYAADFRPRLTSAAPFKLVAVTFPAGELCSDVFQHLRNQRAGLA
jgi:hypothetical protein